MFARNRRKTNSSQALQSNDLVHLLLLKYELLLGFPLELVPHSLHKQPESQTKPFENVLCISADVAYSAFFYFYLVLLWQLLHAKLLPSYILQKYMFSASSEIFLRNRVPKYMSSTGVCVCDVQIKLQN